MFSLHLSNRIFPQPLSEMRRKMSEVVHRSGRWPETGAKANHVLSKLTRFKSDMTRCFSRSNATGQRQENRVRRRRRKCAMLAIHGLHLISLAQPLTINACKGSLGDIHVISFRLSCQRSCCDVTAITNSTAGHVFIQETCIRMSRRGHVHAEMHPHRGCMGANAVHIVLSLMSPLRHACTKDGRFLRARFLPNNTRIRFD